MTHNRVSVGVSPVLPTTPHQAGLERAATEDFHLISSCQKTKRHPSNFNKNNWASPSFLIATFRYKLAQIILHP